MNSVDAGHAVCVTMCLGLFYTCSSVCTITSCDSFQKLTDDITEDFTQYLPMQQYLNLFLKHP